MTPRRWRWSVISAKSLNSPSPNVMAGWKSTPRRCISPTTSARFSPEGLYATVKHVNAIENTWHYGDVQRRNLGGTYRTLDRGERPHPRRSGRQQHRRLGRPSTIPKSNVIRETAEVNGKPQRFRHVGDPEGRADHRPVPVRLRPPLTVRRARHTAEPDVLPRFVLGNWWNSLPPLYRTEYRQLVRRFEKRRHPCSPRPSSIWTGTRLTTSTRSTAPAGRLTRGTRTSSRIRRFLNWLRAWREGHAQRPPEGRRARSKSCIRRSVRP